MKTAKSAFPLNAWYAAAYDVEVGRTLLARTLSAGEPTPTHLVVAGLISDIWLANLLAFISGRVSAEETRDRIDRAVHRLLDSAAAHSEEP